MEIIYLFILWLAGLIKEPVVLLNTGVPESTATVLSKFLEDSMNLRIVRDTTTVSIYDEGYNQKEKAYIINDILNKLDMESFFFKKKVLYLTPEHIGFYKICLHHKAYEYYSLYGITSVNDESCIVSTYLLDTAQLLSQLKVVCMHELGHAFGLTHCLDTSCYMAEGDAFGQYHFCKKCFNELKRLRYETEGFNW